MASIRLWISSVGDIKDRNVCYWLFFPLILLFFNLLLDIFISY